jgi:hypothetical protein
VWKLASIDPTYDYVDEVIMGMFSTIELSNLHSVTPLQGSLTGTQEAYGVSGQAIAGFFPDLSHMPLSTRHQRVFTDLPTSYSDLYQRTKFPDGPNGAAIDNPGICLLCGRVVNAGNRQFAQPVGKNNAGECTLHARVCGADTGVFYLVQKYSVLLVRGGRAIFYPSIYLDANGEAGTDMRGQNRPLFLSTSRLKHLAELYLSGGIPAEVTRQRASIDRVVRMHWF